MINKYIVSFMGANFTKKIHKKEPAHTDMFEIPAEMDDLDDMW